MNDNFIFTQDWTLQYYSNMEGKLFEETIESLKESHDIKFLHISTSGTYHGVYVTSIIAIRKRN